MPERFEQMKNWLNSLGYRAYSLQPASEDASFRRYFRLQQGDEYWIVMDAPPEKEPCDAFIDIAHRLRGIGLSAPEIIHQNHAEGFLLLTDFGDVSYLDQLNADNASTLYGDASAALLQMQTRLAAHDLPVYDETMLRTEMNLFKQWFVEKLLGIELTPNQLGRWQLTTDTLVQSALDQPQCFVHRDYHSRNLMYIEGRNQGRNPAILDFQDAVKGPVSYDLVSLLRDCYIDWPQAQVEQWVMDYCTLAGQAHLAGVEPSQFMHWFNLMGAQRHLKAIGIFARLKLRDGKDKYLQDIPRTLNYLKAVSISEMSLAGLNALINELSLSFRLKSILK